MVITNDLLYPLSDHGSNAQQAREWGALPQIPTATHSGSCQNDNNIEDDDKDAKDAEDDKNKKNNDEDDEDDGETPWLEDDEADEADREEERC